MKIDTQTYTRKPFSVEAIQITKANMVHVAAWCKGTLIEDRGKPFIEVEVHNPLNERQKKGYIGDWVLQSTSGFKVYTQKSFDKTFDVNEPEKPTEVKMSVNPAAVKAAQEGSDAELEEAMTS